MSAIDTAKVASLIATTAAASTTKAKGDALEELICHVFGTIPGISVTRRNKKNAFRTEEIDIAFFNEPTGELAFLPWMILVECKNWTAPVGSESVSWFDTKLRNRGLEFGVMIAAAGITGSADSLTAAHSIVAGALKEKRRLIVVTMDELVALSHSDELVKLIKEKLCDLVAGGTAL